MGKNQHVIPRGKVWAIKGASNVKATLIAETQKEAIDVAKRIAPNQKSELIVHGKNGRIREKNSYGNDPAKIKG